MLAGAVYKVRITLLDLSDDIFIHGFIRLFASQVIHY